MSAQCGTWYVLFRICSSSTCTQSFIFYNIFATCRATQLCEVYAKIFVVQLCAEHLQHWTVPEAAPQAGGVGGRHGQRACAAGGRAPPRHCRGGRRPRPGRHGGRRYTRLGPQLGGHQVFLLTTWDTWKDDSPISMAKVGPLRECQDIVGAPCLCFWYAFRNAFAVVAFFSAGGILFQLSGTPCEKKFFLTSRRGAVIRRFSGSAAASVTLSISLAILIHVLNQELRDLPQWLTSWHNKVCILD